MAVRYGTFRLCVLRTLNRTVPAHRTSVQFLKRTVPTNRTRTITKKAYRTTVPYFFAKIETYHTAILGAIVGNWRVKALDSYPDRVVACLDKTLYDVYLCWEASKKEEIQWKKKSKKSTETLETSKQVRIPSRIQSLSQCYPTISVWRSPETREWICNTTSLKIGLERCYQPATGSSKRNPKSSRPTLVTSIQKCCSNSLVILTFRLFDAAIFQLYNPNECGKLMHLNCLPRTHLQIRLKKIRNYISCTSQGSCRFASHNTLILISNSEMPICLLVKYFENEEGVCLFID